MKLQPANSLRQSQIESSSQEIELLSHVSLQLLTQILHMKDFQEEYLFLLPKATSFLPIYNPEQSDKFMTLLSDYLDTSFSSFENCEKYIESVSQALFNYFLTSKYPSIKLWVLIQKKIWTKIWENFFSVETLNKSVKNMMNYNSI